MSYTAREQALYDVLKAALPRFLFQSDTSPEDWQGAIVKIADACQGQIDDWVLSTQILEATGTMLEQHAKDRGTSRGINESDAALRIRLRTINDVVTDPAITAKVAEIMTSYGEVGTATILELRRYHGYFGTQTASEANPGHKRCFMERGYRMARITSAFIVILPYGTSATTVASIAETLRIIKGGGIFHSVELRANP